MDIEKAEHLNLLIVAVVFLLFLTFVIDHFVSNFPISLSAGLIVTSFILIFLLFEEIIGVAILVFVLVLVLATIIFSSLITGLFIGSLILTSFILLTLLTR